MLAHGLEKEPNYPCPQDESIEQVSYMTLIDLSILDFS